MLRFEVLPDKIFTEVITRSIDSALSEITDALTINIEVENEWDSAIFEKDLIHAYGDDLTAAVLIHSELTKLKMAHESNRLFMPTDRQFQLLDRVIRVFCDIYSDLSGAVPEDKDKENFLIRDENGEPIYEITWDKVFDAFFWDNDYDLKFGRVHPYIPVSITDFLIMESEQWPEISEVSWVSCHCTEEL